MVATQTQSETETPNLTYAQREPLSWRLRAIALLASVSLVVLLVTARRLEPDQAGYGTHQQLGLAPCASLLIWDARCPACGMTTSWAWMVRGRFVEAVQANAGGAMLAIIAMVAVPASCYFCFVGRASRGEWYSLGLAAVLASSLAAASIQWWLR